ncbi:MAG: OsmC family peroxiredoxin [Actinomycetota bacterium]
MRNRAECTWEGDLEGGRGLARLRTGVGGDLPVSWASRTEAPRGETGKTGKTSPEELIAAAHASCYCMALSLVLAENGYGPGRFTVAATCAFEPGKGITTMELEVRGQVPGLDEAAFAKLAETAAKDVCPVSQALKGNVELSLDARLEP